MFKGFFSLLCCVFKWIFYVFCHFLSLILWSFFRCFCHIFLVQFGYFFWPLYTNIKSFKKSLKCDKKWPKSSQKFKEVQQKWQKLNKEDDNTGLCAVLSFFLILDDVYIWWNSFNMTCGSWFPCFVSHTCDIMCGRSSWTPERKELRIIPTFTNAWKTDSQTASQDKGRQKVNKGTLWRILDRKWRFEAASSIFCSSFFFCDSFLHS